MNSSVQSLNAEVSQYVTKTRFLSWVPASIEGHLQIDIIRLNNFQAS